METVTISVLTYNSSKFVLETLESIKAQTYPNLILHVCDDCSTDNTVALCREWIEKNKGRFESTDIIVPDHNTGVSANCNRAWDACTTKYQKEIAGDDILLPNCIADNMAYVTEHPDAVMVFSRLKPFGVSTARCAKFDGNDRMREFFKLSSDVQYQWLYENGNCISAPTCFVDLELIRKIGLRHDERITMFEDFPKWLNAAKLGVRFDFFDKETVCYRIHEKSLSSSVVPNLKLCESKARFWFLYHFIPEYTRDPARAIQLAVDEQVKIYKRLQEEIVSIRLSRRFSLAMSLMKPYDMFRRWLRNLCG